jgi:hypothetical protein
MSQQPTGIEVTAKYSPLLFILAIWKPVIEIDGQQIPAKWGTQFLPVVPGSHRIRVFYKYYWFLPANSAQVDINLVEGQVVQINWKARWMIFLKGKITTAPRPATPAAA